MSEKFDRWYKLQESRAIEEIGKIPEYHDNFVLEAMCEYAWNYQQNKIDKLTKALELIEKDVSWARMTYKDKLKFGLPEEQAIKNRERRYNGVFMTVLKTLEELKESE